MTPTSPLSLFLLRLKWFLQNRQMSGAYAGTARSALTPPKAPYHALPFRGKASVVISPGIPPGETFPYAVIQPPRQNEVNGILNASFNLTLISDDCLSDEAVLNLLDLAYSVLDELTRRWEEIGGPVKLATDSRPVEVFPFQAPGGTYEGQAIPPIQGITLTIPVRQLPAR